MEYFKDLSIVYRIELETKIRKNITTLSNAIKFIDGCKKENGKNAYKFRMFSNSYIEQNYHKFAIRMDEDLYDIIYGYFAYHMKLSPYVYFLIKESMKERGIELLRPPINRHPLIIWSKKFNSTIIECDNSESDTHINFFLLFDLTSEIYGNISLINKLSSMWIANILFPNLAERIMIKKKCDIINTLPLILNSSRDFYVEKPINICDSQVSLD